MHLFPFRSHIKTASSSLTTSSPTAALHRRLSSVLSPQFAGNDQPLTCLCRKEPPRSSWKRLYRSQSYGEQQQQPTMLEEPAVATFWTQAGYRTCQASRRTSRSPEQPFSRSAPTSPYLFAISLQSVKNPPRYRCSHRHYSTNS